MKAMSTGETMGFIHKKTSSLFERGLSIFMNLKSLNEVD